MPFNLKELATLVNGKLLGQDDFIITGFNSLEQAKRDDLVFLAEKKHLESFKNSNAVSVIISEGITTDYSANKNWIIVDDARFAGALAKEKLMPFKEYSKKISSKAIIDSTAIIGKEVTIYPLAFIDKKAVIKDKTVIYPNTFIGEEVVIGKNCLIYPNCSILDRVTIGDNTIIHSGTVIGADGFGFVTKQKKHYKIQHTGSVIIGNNVEIGANCAIDRGSINDTVIGSGSKIDNQVHIAHNVIIGENALISAQFGIAGSSKLGNNFYCGGKVGILGHNIIEDNVIFYSSSVLLSENKTIKADTVLAGIPAIKATEWKKNAVLQKKLWKLEQRLHFLEKNQKNSNTS